MAARPSQTESRSRLSLDRTLRGLFKRLVAHEKLGRYSIEKLHLVEQYQRTASSARIIAVLLLTPLPTFLVLCAMDTVPLQLPRDGARGNSVAFARSTTSHALMTFATLLPMKQALQLTDEEYSFTIITCIAIATSLTVEALCIPLAFAWRFPVPFREIIGLPLWTTSVCVYNYIFAGRALRRHWRRIKLYVPIVGVQITLFYAFLALSVGFAYLSMTAQTIMILTFPLIKLYLKNLVWHYARRLDDLSTDVSICMLEIAGSLYQTVCMQFVVSPVLGAVMLLTDVAQAVLEVRAYMKLDYLGDGKRTLLTAIKIIQSSAFPGSEERPSARERVVFRTKSMPSTVDMTARALLRRSSWLGNEALPGHARMERVKAGTPSTNALVHPLRRGSDHRPILVYGASQLILRTQSRRLLNLDLVQDERGSSSHILTTDARSPTLRASTVTETTAQGHAAGAPWSAGVRRHAKLQATEQQPKSTRQPYSWLSWDGGWLRALLPQRTSDKCEVSAAASLASGAAPSNSVQPIHGALTTGISSGHPNWHKASLYRTPSGKTISVAVSCVIIKPRRSSSGLKRGSAIMIDGIVITRHDQARILEQTLQLMFACEVLLFVEYMEVVVPILYALCIAGQWALPNAQYNLVVMHMTLTGVESNILTSILYATLELASLLVMYWVMKTKYGISAFAQLAFVLESYWMTLQGKLVGSFIVIANAVTVHQGTDFSMRFLHNTS